MQIMEKHIQRVKDLLIKINFPFEFQFPMTFWRSFVNTHMHTLICSSEFLIVVFAYFGLVWFVWKPFQFSIPYQSTQNIPHRCALCFICKSIPTYDVLFLSLLCIFISCSWYLFHLLIPSTKSDLVIITVF